MVPARKRKRTRKRRRSPSCRGYGSSSRDEKNYLEIRHAVLELRMTDGGMKIDATNGRKVSHHRATTFFGRKSTYKLISTQAPSSSTNPIWKGCRATYPRMAEPIALRM